MTMNELVIPLRSSNSDLQLKYTPGRIVKIFQSGANLVVRFLSPPNTPTENCSVSVKTWKPGMTISDGGCIWCADLVVTASCVVGDQPPK